MKKEIVVMGYIFHKGRVLLVNHRKKDTLMSCGGHLKENETFIDCLKREIKEETNLDVDTLSAFKNKISFSEPLPLIINSKKVENKKIIIIEYICLAKDIENLAINRKEISKCAWFSESDLEKAEIRKSVKVILHKAFEVLKSIQ